jgi:hypothetical protein
MKLTVNGVDVPIRDRLEITLEVPSEGGELDWVRGLVVGGPLKIQPPLGTLGPGDATVELLVGRRVDIVMPPDGYGVRAVLGIAESRDLPFLTMTSPGFLPGEENLVVSDCDPAGPPKSWRELPPQI